MSSKIKKENVVGNVVKDLRQNFIPKKLVSGAGYHDFNQEPIFEGRYTGSNSLREKDEANGNGKSGDIIGYIFDKEDDTQVIVGSSHAVSKALDMAEGDHPLLRIEFLGKITLKNGKPFNRFEITQIG